MDDAIANENGDAVAGRRGDLASEACNLCRVPTVAAAAAAAAEPLTDLSDCEKRASGRSRALVLGAASIVSVVVDSSWGPSVRLPVPSRPVLSY